MSAIPLTPSDGSKDPFDQYLTQLVQSTTSRSNLPPIQRGQDHFFSAEHTTRDILSLMAQVQGVSMPRKLLETCKVRQWGMETSFKGDIHTFQKKGIFCLSP